MNTASACWTASAPSRKARRSSRRKKKRRKAAKSSTSWKRSAAVSAKAAARRNRRARGLLREGRDRRGNGRRRETELLGCCVIGLLSRSSNRIQHSNHATQQPSNSVTQQPHVRPAQEIPLHARLRRDAGAFG